MAWHDIPPHRPYTLSAFRLDSSTHVVVPDMATRDTLSKALGAEAVSRVYVLGSWTALTRSRSIIRVLCMVPIYAIVSFLSYAFYYHAIYFEVIRDCYEAFAIASFFALLCHYIAPDLHNQKDYFRGVKPKTWIWPLSWATRCCPKLWRTPRSGLTWFNVRFGIYCLPGSCP